MNQSSAEAAVFVDFDNLFYGLLNGHYGRVHKRALEESYNLLSALRDQIRERDARIVLGRAYSGFDEYPGSEAAHALSLMGFEPQYVVTQRGKNSADLQLSIDVLEVLLTRQDIELFVIIGGDRDYIPIARKVLEAGRDLLIVALPDVASGDLIDRVGIDRFLDATKLVTLPLAEAVAEAGASARSGDLDAEHGVPEVEIPAEPGPATGARILGRIRLPPAVTWTPLSDEEALCEERQARCLRLVLELGERFLERSGKFEVWLSPFLKNEMAETFPDLTHPQRRRLVNLLKEEGQIVVEERESQTGPFPYSVLIPNREHPRVAALAD